MRTRISIVAIAPVFGAMIAGLFLGGPTPATAQLPYEDKGVVFCDNDQPENRTECVASHELRGVTISRQTGDRGNARSGGRIRALHEDGGTARGDHVNVDRCTLNSITECDRNLLNWETVIPDNSADQVPSAVWVDNPSGIYRACGAPAPTRAGHAAQRWLCTPAVSVRNTPSTEV